MRERETERQRQREREREREQYVFWYSTLIRVCQFVKAVIK